MSESKNKKKCESPENLFFNTMEIKDECVPRFIKRLHESKETHTFKNKTGDIVIGISSKGDECITVSMFILEDDVDDIITGILGNDGGYACAISEEFLYNPNKPMNPAIISRFKKAYYKFYNMKLCPCEEHFITDGKDMCIWCDLFDNCYECYECDVCKETVPAHYNMEKTLKCCKKTMCCTCIRKVVQCPFCRATPIESE